MTRFGIDPQVALRIVRDGITVDPGHQVVAPNVLRSQVLSYLYREVREGRLEEPAARVLLDGITALKVRLLGDRVSRANAWRIAVQLNWDDIGQAEFVAVAVLQADAFITLDNALAGEAAALVTIAPFEALVEPPTA